jgi:hypothetical protein
MKTIVFYSYKGGTGRSLLLANYARYLALCGRRVFILDCDLEAPGLHHKFASYGMYHATNLSSDSAENGMPPLGLVDYLPKARSHASTVLHPPLSVPESLEEYVTQLRMGELDSVFFMPAGRAPEPRYAQSVLSIDWKELFPPWDPDDPKPAIGVPLFADLKDRIAAAYRPDFLLIDSRTGITDIGSIAVRRLADSFVCLFLSNPENIEGTRAIVRSLRIDTEAPEIIAVLARVPDGLEGQVLERKVRSDLQEIFLKSPLYLLHEEPSLHVVEELLLGSSQALRDSTLLRDYFRLFLALDERTASKSRYAVLHSYLLAQDWSASAQARGEVQPRFHLLNQIRERNPRVLRHAGRHPGYAKAEEYLSAGYGYVSGGRYGAFASMVLRRLLDSTSKVVENLEKSEAPVTEASINWDLLGIQVGVKFDFSSEPYYLTRYRSLFLNVVPLGYVRTFTCFLVKDSQLHRAIATADVDADIGKAIQQARATDSELEVCLMGESASADVAAKAISPFVSGSSLAFQRDAAGLWKWLVRRDGVGPKRRLVVCDHSVAAKLSVLAGADSKNYVYSSNSADNEQLVFNCGEDIPTGFLYPVADREWRYHINQAVAASIDRRLWGSKDTEGSVAGDLWASGFDPFDWDELVAQLVLGMRPDDAERWLETERPGDWVNGGGNPS